MHKNKTIKKNMNKKKSLTEALIYLIFLKTNYISKPFQQNVINKKLKTFQKTTLKQNSTDNSNNKTQMISKATGYLMMSKIWSKAFGQKICDNFFTIWILI